MDEYQKNQFASAIADAVRASEERGVQQPAVVHEEDGDFRYIPGAWLNDISYTGSKDVVLQFNDASELFGPGWEMTLVGQQKRTSNHHTSRRAAEANQ